MACLAQNIINCFHHWQRIWTWLKVHTELHSPTYSVSSSHGHFGLLLFVLTGTNPISRQPCSMWLMLLWKREIQFKWSEWAPDWHVIQQYFRRCRPPIPLPANDKFSSSQDVFSWKLIIKYYNLPHPCSYCALEKKLIARREASEWITSAGHIGEHEKHPP